MPRLRSVVTGSVVSVDDATAARLDAEWEPVNEKPAKKPASKRAGS